MADEDELLRALGKLAAEEARALEAYERVARGDASSRDEDAVTDREVLEGLRPLGPELEASIAATLAERAAPPRRARSWSRRAASIGAALLLAAGVALVLRPSREGALPSYTVDVPALATMRGPGDAPPPGGACAVRAGSRGEIELTLTPERAVRDEVGVRAYLQRGAELVDAAPRVERSPDGAVRLTVPRTALLGASELRLVVGLPSALDAAPQRAREGGAGPGWQVVRCAVTE